MFEGMGQEFDSAEELVNALRYAAFPHKQPAQENLTAKEEELLQWTIELWEFVYDLARHEDIRQRRLRRGPINPAHIEKRLCQVLNREFDDVVLPVNITEHVAPHTFRVDVNESATFSLDQYPQPEHEHAQAMQLLREIKPSHLSFEYRSLIDDYNIETTDYHAGILEEVLFEDLRSDERGVNLFDGIRVFNRALAFNSEFPKEEDCYV